jgi:hypothetical protein
MIPLRDIMIPLYDGQVTSLADVMLAPHRRALGPVEVMPEGTPYRRRNLLPQSTSLSLGGWQPRIWQDEAFPRNCRRNISIISIFMLQDMVNIATDSRPLTSVFPRLSDVIVRTNAGQDLGAEVFSGRVFSAT